MKTYTVTAKNVPADLAQRIAEAHAQALKNLVLPQPKADGQKPAP